MNLADENEFARVCLYGRFGTGKTTAMAHAAHLGNVMYIDAEKRIKGGPLRRLGVPIERIEPFRTIEFEALEKLIWDVKGRLHDEPGSIAAVGLDGVDETTKLLVGEVVSDNAEKLIARAEKRGEEIEVNPYFVDRDMWGEMTEQFRRFLRHTKDLDCHLMFTSHERRVQDDDGTVSYGPAATPAVQADLMAYVDIVGHTYLDSDHYVARFAPGTKYEAKDTFGVLPKVMANPTMDRIVAYVREELTPETDEVQLHYEAHKAYLLETAKDRAAAAGEEGPRRRRSRA
jgi:hypothetical protein